MARKRLLTAEVGQRLLQSKLQVLAGTGGRRPSLALSILTGGVPEPRPADEDLVSAADPIQRREPLPFPRSAIVEQPGPRAQRRFAARTVYLSDRHLGDLDAIIEAWQRGSSKRLTRSAVLRQAIERLRAAVEDGADPTLEYPDRA